MLSPASVHQVGGGGNDRLGNLSPLVSYAEIQEVDRSEGRLDVRRRRNQYFTPDCAVADLPLPHSLLVAKADVAIAHALLWHVQTGNGHLVKFGNVFGLSRDRVVLMENRDRHDLSRDITDLWHQFMIPWESRHPYQALANSGPTLVLVSKPRVQVGPEEI